MAIPIDINKLLEENIVEWARIEFKEGWNPDTTLKTISAFANDIDNWGGGYIIIGAKESNGQISRPIKGIKLEDIDTIQKEILRYCKFLKPAYIPVLQPVTYEGANLLLIWVPGGFDRPYACPKVPTNKNSEKVYYIRKLSSTIEATDLDFKELMSLAHNVPFDDRINLNSELNDLKHPIIRNYLASVNSALYESSNNMSIEELAKDLRIAGGPIEYFKPLNVGLLFFSDNPEKYFPYTRIEIVNIPDPTGQGMEERIFTGPIDQQLRDALSYIKNNVIAQKVYKVTGQAEAKRVYNYSYDAIEEFLSNAVYHKSYQIHEPITVRIEKDKIEITSIPGPDRSISDSDILNYNMRSRRYRNRRIGDFLKELHLIEGRNTGIPTAINAIKRNQSPLPQLLTDEERSFFSVILDIHNAYKNPVKANTATKRRTKNELKIVIIEELIKNSLSSKALYNRLGYSGSVSKSFKLAINELINEGIIKYEDNIAKNSSKSLLIYIKK